MRDIRFRAWHAGNKNEHGAFYRGHEPKMLYDGKPGDCLRWLAERQNITGIMQFTGLKDRDGVEVWEGDIIRYEWDEEDGPRTDILAVEWVPECAGFVVHGLSEEITVIGNMYEHPHLLEPQ